MALNSSDFPIISYYGRNDGNLKLAICNNATCTNPTLTTVDSAGDVGRFNSLALNSSGNPVISYSDLTNSDLKLAVCDDAICSNPVLNAPRGTTC